MKKRTTNVPTEKVKELEAVRDRIVTRFYVDRTLRSFCWNRLAKCTAWYREFEVNNRKYVALQSYDTIVALWDDADKVLYSLGRYSRTTYQHISKFRDNVISGNYASGTIPEENLELVEWDPERYSMTVQRIPSRVRWTHY